MSLNHKVNLSATLENLHKRLSNVESKFLGAHGSEDADDADDLPERDAYEQGSPFDHDAVLRWRNQHFPAPSPEDKVEHVKAAFEYVYKQMFINHGSGRRRINESLLQPPFDQKWHPLRTPIANGLENYYMKGRLGESISVNMWLNGFKQLSKDRHRQDYSPSAGLLARDCVVRALLSAGRLSKAKASDREAILAMECD